MHLLRKGAESGGIHHLFVCLLLLVSSMTSSALVSAAEKNSPAPEFSLTTHSNEPITLESLKGKAVLINFWASWCKPCREEVPELIKLFDKYKDQGFELVGINIDKEKPNADRFIREFGINYTVAFDPEMEVINSYRATGMPSSFIVDKEGVVREIIYGFSHKKKLKMENTIDMILGEQTAQSSEN